MENALGSGQISLDASPVFNEQIPVKAHALKGARLKVIKRVLDTNWIGNSHLPSNTDNEGTP
jgi:hypothetical protein